MIKKVYLYYCLILVFNINFSFGMEPDFHDPNYIKVKTELFKAVQTNNFPETKKIFGEIFYRLENKFAPPGSNSNQRDHYSKSIKPLFLDNLLFSPEENSIIKAALKNQNITILFFLLYSNVIPGLDNLGSYLNDNLIIDPEDDENYQESKEKLQEAIKSTNLDETKKLFNEIFNNLLKHFSPESFGAWTYKYYTNHLSTRQ